MLLCASAYEQWVAKELSKKGPNVLSLKLLLHLSLVSEDVSLDP